MYVGSFWRSQSEFLLIVYKMELKVLRGLLSFQLVSDTNILQSSQLSFVCLHYNYPFENELHIAQDSGKKAHTQVLESPLVGW